MSNLVMVMPYRAFVIKAREEGHRICAIWDPTLQTADYLHGIAELADAFVLTDFSDPVVFDRAVRRAAQDFDADAIYHIGAEDSMLATYRIAEELGKAVNPSRSIELLNDKLAMRRLLAEHGMSPVRFATADRWQDVPALLGGFELPVVVKPTELAGSRGVYLLHHAGQVEEWGRLLDSCDYRGPVLVEEYLRGPEFSVETLSDGGRHQVVGVTRKVLGPPPLFVEAGHVHPAPDGPDTRAIGELAVRLLTAAGYRTGPAHTEVIWTSSGPRIVESQARLGGDQIPRLVQLSTGIDIERAVFRILGGRAPGPRERRRVAHIAYFSFTPGLVRSVQGVEEARALGFVDMLEMPFQPGGRVPVTVDWRTRHGFVVVSGDTEEQALARARHVQSLVRVEVEPDEIAARVPAGAGAPS
ncbi:ATP-grasp domain-containing protein [Microbispora sp. ATCC PTA-5024]|uniref:ATP-grasp domain-containing protein n=1 Tax=Microbispora sp. ATCC PTA-5024 TaxID=316330 RepID=UPI0003DC4F28|nr:ATP-grasp domain-containing protein [Microbispora sp. ATCC PTA-5024]ETK35455.1 carboxylate--amine ligase [Microbispora sp. ATCC PTA-5024]